MFRYGFAQAEHTDAFNLAQCPRAKNRGLVSCPAKFSGRGEVAPSHTFRQLPEKQKPDASLEMNHFGVARKMTGFLHASTMRVAMRVSAEGQAMQAYDLNYLDSFTRRARPRNARPRL